MVDFMNSKDKIYHKIGLKEISHKELFLSISIDTQGNVNKFLNDSLKRDQELKNHYNSHFIQGSGVKPSNIICNYYYKVGHISLECQLRK
jgi:hypothetical protein